MRLTIVIPLLVVFLNLSWAQLNLPDMPGPPYPDKYGNNRWGVKYDPRVHGRGRQHSSPSTSGTWGGELPQYSPSVRYRPAQQSTRSKWTAALKPLVSRSRFLKSMTKRKRRPNSGPIDPTSDSFYKHPYTSQVIDGYVKNYLNTYNKVSQTRPSSELASIRTFANPTSMSGKSRTRNIARSSSDNNRRSFSKSASSTNGISAGNTSSLIASYSRAAAAAGTSDTNSKPLYRTVDPQKNDIFRLGPLLEKKKSDFAKTLSSIYNDYKPGDENTVGSSSLLLGSSDGGSSSSINVVAATDSLRNSETLSDDDYSSPSYSYQSPPPSSSPPENRPSLESLYKTGPSKPIPLFSYTTAEPLVSFNGNPVEYYSKSPMAITNSGDDENHERVHSKFLSGSFSSSSSSAGPVTVSSYTMSEASPFFSSSPYHSSAFDSDGHSGPVSSLVSHYPTSSISVTPSPPIVNNVPSAPLRISSDAPIPVLKPIAPISVAPVSITPFSYIPSSNLYYTSSLFSSSSASNNDKSKKSKRKKQPLQHTPINVLRGLLGRNERRDRTRDSEDDDYKSAYAVNYPLALPPPVPPPQYAYNPYINTLASAPVPLDYPAPMYAAGLPPPPPPPPHYSPLSVGISNLRDSLVYSRPPPPPPPPRFAPQSTSGDTKKEGGRPLGLFGTMGNSVDAVAGAANTVRREISKMTGKTLSKGVLLGGSTIFEVSKSISNVINKMSSI